MSLSREDALLIERLMLPGKWTWRHLSSYVWENRADIFHAQGWGLDQSGNQIMGMELCSMAADVLRRDADSMPFFGDVCNGNSVNIGET